MSKPSKKTNPHGGVVHTYRGYDPGKYPMPAAEGGDMVAPAFNHLMEYGSLDDLSPEQLADAVEIDPSQIQGLGPSLQSLLAMLEERKRKILETYETKAARAAATNAFRTAAADERAKDIPERFQPAYQRAIAEEQLIDLERLWYRLEGRSSFAGPLLQIMEQLGRKYQIEQLAAKYDFTGRQEMSIDKALEIKEELETIDRLIEQLREAAKNAKVYLIDMEALGRFAESDQMEGLEQMRRQVDELLRQVAEQQGLREQDGRISITPKAFKIFQSKLLDQIFADLQAARTGRHSVNITGDGAVEMQRTRPYEFGDSPANMDIPATLINAMLRDPEAAKASKLRLRPEDIEIHLTRNTPKCATAVCMDMSGSMRYNGQYINVKRMALALHGLIRTEYPGDFVDFIEVCSLPARKHISEVSALLPKPVTIFDPVVRLKADMSDERITASDIPPHFTNIQRGLSLARQMLQVQDTPNRQILLITDGLPTAHFEGNWLYLLYPPNRRTEQETMREGLRCAEQGITINIFLLSSWGQTEEDVQFAHRLAESTNGRVFFVGGRELDRFVVWDYVKRRRFILG